MSGCNWDIESKSLMKAELVRRNINYKDLSAILKNAGVKEIKVGSIANKINRGRFSFSFALQVFHVLGIEFLNFANIEVVNLKKQTKQVQSEKIKVSKKTTINKNNARKVRLSSELQGAIDLVSLRKGNSIKNLIHRELSEIFSEEFISLKRLDGSQEKRITKLKGRT